MDISCAALQSVCGYSRMKVAKDKILIAEIWRAIGKMAPRGCRDRFPGGTSPADVQHHHDPQETIHQTANSQHSPASMAAPKSSPCKSQGTHFNLAILNCSYGKWHKIFWCEYIHFTALSRRKEGNIFLNRYSSPLTYVNFHWKQ